MITGKFLGRISHEGIFSILIKNGKSILHVFLTQDELMSMKRRGCLVQGCTLVVDPEKKEIFVKHK